MNSLSAETVSLLVVDDSDSGPTVADELRRSDDRLSVERVTSVGEALDRVADVAVDCLVAEYSLSDGTGLDLLEAVRDGDPSLPVILYTAAGSEAVASAAITAGVSDYVRKDAGSDQSALLASRVIDAVERHRSQRALEASEHQFSLFFQQSSLGAIEWDDEGRLVRMNDAAEAILGYDEAELRGERWDSLVPTDSHDTIRDLMSRLLANDGGYHSVNENKRKDGERIVCEWHNRVVTDTDGSVVGLYTQFSDVTEKQRQRAVLEQRERALREMHGIISAVDTSFTEKVDALVSLGREVLEVSFGMLSKVNGDEYDIEAAAKAHDLALDLRVGDTYPLSESYCEAVVNAERTIVVEDIDEESPERRFPAVSTEMEVSSYLGAPLFVDGTLYGTFCFYDTGRRADAFSEWEVTFVDLMSGWVSYELDHQQATERLRRQNTRLEQFASFLSHDLRNPLTVAKGRLELGREECDNEHFALVERSHDRIETLIEDVLLLARVGRGIDETEPLDLGAIVTQCWQGVETANATLRNEATTVIEADETRLKQMLENLINNAVEHSDETVTVTVGDLDDGFFVEDDGGGVPADVRGRIFDSGYSTKVDGTGFGLAIVEDIVDEHGWTITLTESEAGGARFELTGVDVR